MGGFHKLGSIVPNFPGFSWGASLKEVVVCAVYCVL